MRSGPCMATLEPCGPESEAGLFVAWFQTLSAAERRWFLDKLVSVATPYKLFAQLERALETSRRIPDSWTECGDFEERALFCVTRVRGWSAARANSFVNELEQIDQDTVYEFYDQIASCVKEP